MLNVAEETLQHICSWLTLSFFTQVIDICKSC